MAKSDIFSYNTEMYSVKKTNKVVDALIYVGLVVWLLIDLFPLYYLLTFSFKSSKEITGSNVIGLPMDETAMMLASYGIFPSGSGLAAGFGMGALF